MNLKNRVMVSLVLTILFLGIAVLVWANQTHRITIWGSPPVIEKKLIILNPGLVILKGSQEISVSATSGTNTMPTFPPSTTCLKGTWTATTDDTRLKLSSTSGELRVDMNPCANSYKFSITYDSSGLSTGLYTANITINANWNDMVAEPITFPVKIIVGTVVNDGRIISRYYSYIINASKAETIFWNDKSITGGSGTFFTTFSSGGSCYTDTELTQLMSEIDQSGFWTSPNGSTQESIHVLAVNKQNVSKTLSLGCMPGGWGAPVDPKICAVDGKIANWINSHNYRTWKNGVCSVGNIPTDTQPPTAPTNLTVATNSSTQLTLTWTPSTDNVGVTEYRIYNTDTSGTTEVGRSNTNSWSMTGPQCNTPYNFHVRAYDAIGNFSQDSNPATATTPACGNTDAQAPAKPTNLQATAIDYQSVKLSWTASTGSTGYDIYDQKTITRKISTASTNYTFSGLQEKTEYKYYVKAHNAAGESEASNTAIATTPAKSSGSDGSGGTGGGSTSSGGTNSGSTSGGGSSGIGTSSGTSITNLVSTGQALWFNIGIAIILAGIIAFFIIRKKPDKDQNIETYNNY